MRSEPGKGSAFTISLPLVGEVLQAVPGVVREVGASTGKSDMPLVLLIDDDPQIHHLLGSMLTRDGYQVEHCSSGKDALAHAHRVRPAVILLDVMMPQVDGWTVLGALKKDAVLADIPVVIVSLLDERPLGLTLGAADFLTKPVDRSKLISTVRTYTATTGSRILVVDDNADDRHAMGRVLAGQGYKVFEMADGASALEWLNANPPPHVMLLDLLMDGMDGFTLLDRVRAQERLRDMKVLVLSAKDISTREATFLLERGGTVIPKGPNALIALSGALKGLCT